MSSNEQNQWVEATGLDGADQRKILATGPVGEINLWARHIYQENKYEQTYLMMNIPWSGNALIGEHIIGVGLKTLSDGTEEKSFHLSVIHEGSQLGFIWTSENPTRTVLEKSEVSKSRQESLINGGIASIKKISELPEEIDVEAAVNHWLGKILECKANPAIMTGKNFSALGIEAIVGQFAVGN